MLNATEKNDMGKNFWKRVEKATLNKVIWYVLTGKMTFEEKPEGNEWFMETPEEIAFQTEHYRALEAFLETVLRVSVLGAKQAKEKHWEMK